MFFLIFAAIAVGFAQNVTEADGFGLTLAQAVNDALRKALEQNTGEKIFAHPVVTKYPVLREVMISRKFGLLSGQQVLLQQQESETHLWRVRVKAEISPTAGRQWCQLRDILQGKGLPAIMFCVRETLDEKILTEPVAEYQLQQKFEDMGFKVIERQWSDPARDLHQKQLFAKQVYPEIVEAGLQCGVHFIVIGELQGKYVEAQESSDWICHDYNFAIQIISIENAEITTTFQWPFRYQQDPLEHSQKSAGKAGFAEIINPECIEGVVIEIVKSWIGGLNALSAPNTAKGSWK